MAWDNEKVKGYRVFSKVFNLFLDVNAAGDFANDPNSYETPKTTSDPLAFQAGLKRKYTYSDAKISVDCFPNLQSLSITPAILKIGEDVSLSASANVSLTDFISNDTYELQGDYSDRRVEASHFKKLMARNFIENRDCEILMGYLPESFDETNYLKQNFVVKNFAYNDRGGAMSFSLIDRLFYVSDTKNKAPLTSDVTLNGAIDSSVTTLNFIGTTLGDKGFNTITNGDTGLIVIDNEIMSYTVTSFTGNSGSMTITRGEPQGDPAKDHSDAATIQGVLAFVNTLITDVVLDLFFDYSKINGSVGAIGDYVDSAGINALGANELSDFLLTNYITKPTEIRTLLKELMQCSGAYLYFDVTDNLVKMGIVPNFAETQIVYDEDTHILQDSLKITTEYSKQVTRAKIWSNKQNYTQGNEARYYANSFERRDDLREGLAQYIQVFQPKDIFCNWLTGTTQDQKNANDTIALKVSRFSAPPDKLVFRVGSEWIGDVEGQNIWYGSAVGITTKQRLLPNGDPRTYAAQIIAIKPIVGRDEFEITAISYNSNAIPSPDFIIANDQSNFNLADNLVPTEAREYTVIIEPNVRITSTSTGNPAFDTGVFPVGASLKIINQGFIYGTGGLGGSGGAVPVNGGDGGLGLNLQVDTVIDNLLGNIGGGGGGGGGTFSYFNANGSGGGGGAGGIAVIGGFGDTNGVNGEVSGFGFAGKGGRNKDPEYDGVFTVGTGNVLGTDFWGFIRTLFGQMTPEGFIYNGESCRFNEAQTLGLGQGGYIELTNFAAFADNTGIYFELNNVKHFFTDNFPSSSPSFQSGVYEDGTVFSQTLVDNVGNDLDFKVWFGAIEGLYGGNGGELGEAGQDGMGTSGTTFGTGGAAGNAIDTNGNSLVIEAGSSRIYGAIDGAFTTQGAL